MQQSETSFKQQQIKLADNQFKLAVKFEKWTVGKQKYMIHINQYKVMQLDADTVE